MKIWSLLSVKEIASIQAHNYPILPNLLEIAHDGDIITGAYGDPFIKRWKVSHPTSCFPILTLLFSFDTGQDSIQCFTLLDNDKQLASGAVDYSITIFDIIFGTLIKTIPASDNAMSLISISSGKHIAAGLSESVIIYDVTTEAVILQCDNDNGYVSYLFQLNDNILLSGSFDGPVNMWDISIPSSNSVERSVHVLTGHSDRVHGLALLEGEEDLIVSSSDDGTIKVWTVTTGKCIDTWSLRRDDIEQKFSSVFVLGDGRSIASGLRDGTIIIWKEG